MGPEYAWGLFQAQPLHPFGAAGFAAGPIAYGRNQSIKSVDYVPAPKAAKAPKVPLMTRAKGTWTNIVGHAKASFKLTKTATSTGVLAPSKPDVICVKDATPALKKYDIFDYMSSFFSCFRAPAVYDDEPESPAASSPPADDDTASTSGRDHTAAAAAPQAMTMSRAGSMNADINTILPEDVTATIQVAPSPDPNKSSIPNPNKAALASLLAPPAGYVPLTPEERAAAREAGRLAREAEKRAMDARMAAADAKARAAAQGAGSFFDDLSGMGAGEELGGSLDDDEESEGMPLEEEEEDTMLDVINDSTFRQMADWVAPAEDVIAAGRAAFVREQEEQAAAMALLKAQMAAFAAGQGQQH